MSFNIDMLPHGVFTESVSDSVDDADYKLIHNNHPDADAYWTKCLDLIKDNVASQVFKTWFEPLKAVSLTDGNKLTIQVPSQFYAEWIEEHYYQLLSAAIKKILGDDSKLLYHVVIDESDSLQKRTIKLPALKNKPMANQNSLPFSSNHLQNQDLPTFLNPRYTLDGFVVGESNKLAASVAKAICDNPGKFNRNPFFIFGDTGVGKTHLVQGIGNFLVRNYRKMKIAYTSSEKFYIDFINALQNNKMNDFTYYYRMADVLIVDDIHFFSGKEKTQDSFFHTFNSLHQAGKLIILTSDRHQHELKDIDKRLISRFQWGLTVDIQPPDLETRIAILKKKSEDEGFNIPFNILEYLAQNVTKSVRELEGVLISLITKVTFDKRPLSIDIAREVIYVNKKTEVKIITMDDIKLSVSDYYKIPTELMESKIRKHEIALARQMCMYLSKQLTQLSLKSIGSHFGNRDHSTVLHSCQAIENYLVTDKTVRHAHEYLFKSLRNGFE